MLQMSGFMVSKAMGLPPVTKELISKLVYYRNLTDRLAPAGQGKYSTTRQVFREGVKSAERSTQSNTIQF